MQVQNEKIGILGGTFDPIHYGHIKIAEELREEFKLDRVIFIPSGNPPHKLERKVSEAFHRCNMVKMAISGNQNFELSRIEMDRPGKTYTIDTIRQLKDLYPCGTRFYFIVGADVIPELTLWKDYNSLFYECEFIAVMRPEFEKDKFVNEIKYLKETYSAKINVVEVSLIGISSTIIRARVKDGQSIKDMLPAKVESYILENGLYF